jgi:hypothetical protein
MRFLSVSLFSNLQSYFETICSVETVTTQTTQESIHLKFRHAYLLVHVKLR